MIRIRDEAEDAEAVDAALLTAALDGCLDARADAGAAGVVVDLLLLNDDSIAAMNAAHKGRAGPTDVLAFFDGEPDDDEDAMHLGDVAVSVETARREATARGVAPPEELALYAIHGLLHLLGFRDSDDEERAAMRTAEAEELARHNITPHW